MRGFINPPIGGALSTNLLQGDFGAKCVINLKRWTVSIAEIELGNTTRQVGFAAMLADALHAAPV